MSKYLDRAKEIRAIEIPHYNCTQGVLVPFAEDLGITEEQAYKIGANFGKGMKIGSVCGAVTGGLMVLGLAGVDDPVTVGAYLKAVRDHHEGMIDCKDLLRRNKEVGKNQKQHCDDMVYECLELVEQILKDKGIM